MTCQPSCGIQTAQPHIQRNAFHWRPQPVEAPPPEPQPIAEVTPTGTVKRRNRQYHKAVDDADIVALVRRAGPMLIADVSRHTGLNEKSAQVRLRELRNTGLIASGLVEGQYLKLMYWAP